MLHPGQIQLIHVAKHKVFGRHDDASYRLLLRNIAGVESSRDLTNQTFEDVMAVLEDSGFTDQVHGPGYWVAKSAGAGRRERLAHKIKVIYGDGSAFRYPLSMLCYRFSIGRTGNPGELGAREAWNLIEMLKSVAAREEEPAPF